MSNLGTDRTVEAESRKKDSPKLAPIADPKDQEHYFAAAEAKKIDYPHDRDLLQAAAKANERTPIGDQSEPFKGGREKLLDGLKQLIPDLQSGKLTAEAFGDRINKLFKERGLPPLSVEPHGPLGQSSLLGDYVPGQGKLQLSLRGQTESAFLGEVAHEVTHAEQDVLMIRSMMDHQHVGKKMTTEQMAKVKDEYKNKVGVEPADSWVRSIAEARNGKTLTPAERKRADGLVADTGDAVRNPFDVPNRVDNELFQIMKDYLSEPGKGAKAVVQAAIGSADDGNLFSQGIGKMLFKNPHYTKDDVIKAFGDPTRPDFDETRAHQEIDRRLSDYEKETRAQYNTYRGRKHEAEAFDSQSQFLSGVDIRSDRSRCLIIDGKIVCSNP